MSTNSKSELFKKLQKACGLSNAGAAEWLGYDLATIKRWRNGEQDPAQSAIMSLSYRVTHGASYEVDVSNVDVSEPARLTKAIIVKAVCEATGVKPEYVSLDKDDDGYSWGGKAGAVFDGSWVDARTLNGQSLSWWIDEFKYRLHESIDYSSYDSLNELIESIDWNVEYE